MYNSVVYDTNNEQERKTRRIVCHSISVEVHNKREIENEMDVVGRSKVKH